MVYRWHMYLWCEPGRMKDWDGKHHGRYHARFTRVREHNGIEEGHWCVWTMVHAGNYRDACTQLKLWADWFGYCLDDAKVGRKANLPPVFRDDRDPWDQTPVTG